LFDIHQKHFRRHSRIREPPNSEAPACAKDDTISDSGDMAVQGCVNSDTGDSVDQGDSILANTKICQYTARTTPYDRVYLENDNVVRYISDTNDAVDQVDAISDSGNASDQVDANSDTDDPDDFFSNEDD